MLLLVLITMCMDSKILTFFHPRHLLNAKTFLSMEDFETVIYNFVLGLLQFAFFWQWLIREPYHISHYWICFSPQLGNHGGHLEETVTSQL